MSGRQDLRPYEGTAWYYSRFRPAYPPALVAVLRDRFALDGTGRLLDLGCGPGSVAIKLAHLFDHVVAVDPEPDMLAEGQAEAHRAGVSNIEWIRASCEELSPRLGRFRLATIGESLHWMDRERTLDALYDLIEDGGGVAVVGRGVPLPTPPVTPWRAAANRVVRQYVGDRQLPWDSPAPPPENRHEAYLARSRFRDLKTYNESFDIEWTLDSMVGNLYSMSFCSRRILDDRVEAFERDLREAVLAVEPSGRLRGEQFGVYALMAWKR
jgi:SAM-dependent methyltransferase